MEYNITKELKEIESKLGIEAYNKILAVFGRMSMKIDEITKSRNKWKEKALGK
jgi:hypothetical protein